MARSLRQFWVYLLPAGALAVMVAALSVFITDSDAPEDTMTTLTVYCADEVRLPVEQIVDHFQRRSGIRVHAHFQPSDRLTAQMNQAGDGDLVIAADESVLQPAHSQQTNRQTHPVAYLAAVMLVRSETPHNIHTVADLAGPEVKLGVPVAETLIAAVTSAIFRKNDIDMERIVLNRAFSGGSSAELAQAVELGQVDAAIVWPTAAQQYAYRTEMIEIPPDHNVMIPIVAAGLTPSSHPDAVRQFLEFLNSPVAQESFEKYGLITVGGGFVGFAVGLGCQ